MYSRTDEEQISRPVQPRPQAVLADVYTLRRRIALGVYAVITFDLPIYYLTGYTLMEIVMVAIVGWVVAGGAIYVAFGQIIKLRKRTSYPELLLVRLGDTTSAREAAAEALLILEGLLETDTSFIAIETSGVREVVSTRGASEDEARWVLETHSGHLETAMGNRYPADVLNSGGHCAIFVPVVALNRPIGALYLTSSRRSELLDRSLLNDIGHALGLSLENLRQKEQLLHKEARLRSVVTGAPIVLFSVNNAGIVVFHQGQAMEQVGIEPETLIGRSVADIYQNYPGILQSFRRAFAGDEAVSTATIEANGNRVIFEYRLVPEKDEHGRVTGVIGVATDVTQRKVAADALREGERFLSTLVANLPGFVIRLEGDPLAIKYVSDGVREITGFAASELTGQPIEVLAGRLHPEDRALMGEVVRRARESGEAIEYEFRFTHRSGEERWFWQQGQVVADEDGQPVALEMFTMDITERKHANDALRESERFLSALVGNLPGFVLRAEMRDVPTILYVSEGIRDATGIGPEALIGQPVTVLGDTMYEEDKWRLAALVQEAAKTTGHFEIEFRVKDPATGGEKWLWEQAQVIADEDGNPANVEAFIMDITERKRAEQALEASEERFRGIYENARDAMFTYDFNGRILSANERMAEMLGYTKEELLEIDVGKVVAPDYHEIAAEGLKSVFNGDQSSYEIELMTRDGRRVPVEITCRFVFDENGNPSMVQGIGRDISERKQAEETIRRLAYHDSLTGLPNRALFEDRLRVALAQARRNGETVGVLFLDIDSFKLVNDTLGHGAGDKLLQSVGNDLSVLVRDCDTVARVGGDEFTLLLPSIEQAQDVTDIAQRILECLRQPRVLAGQEFRATASIGVTMFPADGEDGETLLRNADTAMYRAKDHGRDNYQLFTAAMNQLVADRLSFEQSLRQALSRNELKVFYQPIIDIETGRITAAEALVRWFHPTLGTVMPDAFIPLAEETGIILEIGEAVLREACRQIMEWRAHGIDLGRVTVNLSARQLQQEDLVSRVAGILQATGVPAKLLQLEITEGAVMKNVDHAIAMLHQLRQMGISIALDDFGTGYSSLTYLKRFPVDAVKIDRSFVRDIEHDASDATIVSTVIAMAENLGLRVIAEGVETPQQLAFLRARGCTEFQGYLFSQPVPPEQFAGLMTAGVAQNGANGTKTKGAKPLTAA